VKKYFFPGGSIEDLFEMAGTVAATLAEAGASPQEIATAMKAALSGKIYKSRELWGQSNKTLNPWAQIENWSCTKRYQLNYFFFSFRVDILGRDLISIHSKVLKQCYEGQSYRNSYP
jgi:hypothetical protein